MPLLMRLLIVLGFIPLFAVSKSQSSKASVSSLSSLMDSIFPQECGIRMIGKTKRGRVKRIVGGYQSSQGKWPWQVALYFKGHHYCGGAVISNTWILTAAHCFNPHTSSKPEDWTAVLGDHSLKERDERFEQRRNILNITIHEGYRSMWYEKIYDTPPLNDVAIMKLDKALVFNNYVQPLCLPRPHDIFAPNKECYVAGWGHTEWNGTQPDILREAKVRIVSRDVCNQEKSYNGTIHNTAMCAGYPEGGTDACEYDSGGPLVCSKCGRYYAAGLVSWGDQCALPYKYGVYSNLTVLTPWITERISTFERDKVALSVFQG